MFPEITDRFLTALGPDTVFGDHDRLVVATVDILEHVIETRRDDLPSKLGVAGITLPAGAEEKPYQAGLLAVVVVDADEVARVGHHVEMIVILPHHHVVNGAGWVEKAGFLPVGQGPDAHDPGIRTLLADDRRGITEHVCGDPHRLLVSPDMDQQARRPVGADPSDLQGPVRLVLGNVDAHVGLGRFHDAAHMGLPGGTHVRVEEVGLGLVLGVEPFRECEMPESDDRFDTRFATFFRHLGVASQCLLIDLALAGFDPGPLYPESEMVYSKVLQGGEVLVELAPGIDGAIPPCRGPSLFGKTIPVRFEVPRTAGCVSLVLVLERGRGTAPPKGLLGQRLERRGSRRGCIGTRCRDASGKEEHAGQEKCQEQGADGCLMHGRRPSSNNQVDQ